MHRYFLWIAFDGTAYHGWQIQENAHSVQAEINRVLGTVFQQKVETTGCGRTDTGVHARMFALHFDLENPIADPANLEFKLNRMLPGDIAVLKLSAVHPAAHARHSAISRSYAYSLHQGKDPFLEKYSSRHPAFAFPERMAECTALLLGLQSFRCFCKAASTKDNYDCEILSASWDFEGQSSIFRISANRFLRNMVRAIVGTLLEVGMGRLSVDEFRELLASGHRSDAGVSVPAKGLFLEKVSYGTSIGPPWDGLP